MARGREGGRSGKTRREEGVERERRKGKRGREGIKIKQSRKEERRKIEWLG